MSLEDFADNPIDTCDGERESAVRERLERAAAAARDGAVEQARGLLAAESPTTIRRGWLHETHPGIWYRWVRVNELLRNDETGIEISQRPARASDVICGARTTEPGIPGLGSCDGVDLSVDHEVVCIFAGDHGEAPHIGAIPCGDMAIPGECSEFGSYHVVVDGFAIRPSVAPGVAADQDVWGPNESEEP